MKKLLIVLCLLICLFGCNSSKTNAKYHVGVIQFAKHEALDSATNGFKDALEEEFGDEVWVDVKPASGDGNTCNVIASSFVAENVDLILGNATPALQSAAHATSSTDIPVLGTAVTEYGTALEIEMHDGLTMRNVSGTSDLAPLEDQAKMFKELLPNAKTIGLLYCSTEKNSIYQIDTIEGLLNNLGLETKRYSFSTSGELDLTVSKACGEIDALYVPTDNTCADNGGIIANAANVNNIPVITGEKNTLLSCEGLASLSIDYYELGRQTGEMAIKILKGEKDIKDMKIEFYNNPVKLYSEKKANEFNISIPSNYQKIEEN